MYTRTGKELFFYFFIEQSVLIKKKINVVFETNIDRLNYKFSISAQCFENILSSLNLSRRDLNLKCNK